jgi:hypothetical protein
MPICRFISYPSFREALKEIAAYQFPQLPKESAYTKLVQAARRQQPTTISHSTPATPSATGGRHIYSIGREDAVAALLHRMMLLRWREQLKQLGVHDAVDMSGVELRDLLNIGMKATEAHRYLDSVRALDSAGALIAADLAQERQREAEADVSAAEAAAAAEHHGKQLQLPHAQLGIQWEECVRKDGYVYYFHHPSGSSSWHEPQEGSTILTLAQKQRQHTPREAAAPRSPQQLQYATQWPRGTERQGWRDTWLGVMPSPGQASTDQGAGERGSAGSDAGVARAPSSLTQQGPHFTPVQRRAATRAAREVYAADYASGAVSHSALPGSVQGHLAAEGNAQLGGNVVHTPTVPPKGARLSISDADLDEAFLDLPGMTTETKRAIAKSHVFASSRVRGYADPRPDLRPVDLARWRPGAEHNAAVNQMSTKDAAFAGVLRPSHHREQSREGRSGREILSRTWNPPELAPSDAVPSYAYRHAAARLQDSVFDRLTDTRGFTGSHRHRFDDTGRGRGLKGRDAGDMDYAKLTSVVPVAGAPYMTEAPRGRFRTTKEADKA